jgi:hypothetical protein
MNEVQNEQSFLKEQANKVNLESPLYLSSEQNRKYVKGNLIAGMITFFLLGASLLETTSKNILEFKFLNGLFCAFTGLLIHLIYIKLKKREWTTTDLINTYKRNFILALIVIFISFFSNIPRINLDSFHVMAWLNLLVLSTIFTMYIKNKKLAHYAFAIYSLVPIASEFLFHGNGNTIFCAFGFYVAAQSTLISGLLCQSSDST